MGRFIEDRFEAEFIIEQPLQAVWQSLEIKNDTEAAWLSAWPRMGDDKRTGEVVEVAAPHRVRVHKSSEPCKGSEIAITLESVDNGTRVMVVQSGFPAWVKLSLESFTIGGNQIVADLALFLQRGVVISRHSMPWAFAGFTTNVVDTGVEIASVMPGGYAERVGLEAGDLLMTLGGTPVFTQQCVQTMLRVFKAGQDLDASWVRDRELQQGSSLL